MLVRGRTFGDASCTAERGMVAPLGIRCVSGKEFLRPAVLFGLCAVLCAGISPVSECESVSFFMLKSHGAPGGSDRRHDAVYLAQDGFVQRVEETDSGAIRSVREGRADTQAFFGQLAEAMPAWRQKRTNGAGQTDSAPPPLTEYLPAELTIWVDTPGKPLFYGKEALDKSGGAFPESVRSICEQAERICNSATVVSLSPAQCYIRAFRLDEQTAKEFSSARLFRTPSLPELQASAELGRALDTPYRLLPVPRDCNPYRAFRSRFEPMGDAAEFLVNGKPYQVRTYCAKAE